MFLVVLNFIKISQTIAEISHLTIFLNGSVYHLVFFKFNFLNNWITNIYHHANFHQKWSKPLCRYRVFLDFRVGHRLSCWILQFSNFWSLIGWGRRISIAMWNFIKIGQMLASRKRGTATENAQRRPELVRRWRGRMSCMSACRVEPLMTSSLGRSLATVDQMMMMMSVCITLYIKNASMTAIRVPVRCEDECLQWWSSWMMDHEDGQVKDSRPLDLQWWNPNCKPAAVMSWYVQLVGDADETKFCQLSPAACCIFSLYFIVLSGI